MSGKICDRISTQVLPARPGTAPAKPVSSLAAAAANATDVRPKTRASTPSRRIKSSCLRQHPLTERAHLADDFALFRAFEIEVDRGDAEIFERVDVADDVGGAAGKQPAF